MGTFFSQKQKYCSLHSKLIGTADFQVFITIGNLPFWMPIYIAIHEETACQADHLLRECSIKMTLWLQGAASYH
jgi:hypothetical protein